jgi:hypothetical protein
MNVETRGATFPRAERHVAKAARLVERQRTLLAKIQRDGHDSRVSERLLASLGWAQ